MKLFLFSNRLIERHWQRIFPMASAYLTAAACLLKTFVSIRSAGAGFFSNLIVKWPIELALWTKSRLFHVIMSNRTFLSD